MFAPWRAFGLAHFPKSNVEVVPELAEDTLLNRIEARRMECRRRHVTKLGYTRRLLEKLYRIEIVEDRFVHVKRGQRNAPSAAAHEEFLLAARDFRHGGPRKFEVPISQWIGEPDQVAGAI